MEQVSLYGLKETLFDYVAEAIDAYIRVANQHGWAVPQGWSAKALIISTNFAHLE
ncbi:1905_t:CDS:2 [Rhizophagus irregularis]|nr:1905_t:CDS:2 [Rhizophagus irregularis]